ncbi:sema domain, immunoglobulin domain (Ig), short basic domain, secreted, (semaphorin) 3Fa isoform X1 [Tachysurus ichikawai]
MIVQSTRDLFLGTLLVSVFSAVSVQSNPFASLPPLSAPRIYLSFKACVSVVRDFFYNRDLVTLGLWLKTDSTCTKRNPARSSQFSAPMCRQVEKGEMPQSLSPLFTLHAVWAGSAS